MSEVLVLMSVSFAVGLIIGLLLMNRRLESRERVGYERARGEAEDEKATISRDLREQLVRVRNGLAESAASYAQVVKTVEEKLPISEEKLIELYGEREHLLQLDFHPPKPGQRFEEPDEDLEQEYLAFRAQRV